MKSLRLTISSSKVKVKKKPSTVEEYFDLETYTKQLQKSITESKVYDPTNNTGKDISA